MRTMEGMPLYFATATRGGDIRDSWGRVEERVSTTAEKYYHRGRPPCYIEMSDMIDWKVVPKPLYAKINQDMIALHDSLVLCFLLLHFYETYEYVPQINSGHMEALNLVTGMGVDLDELRKIGDRIYNLERRSTLERAYGGKTTGCHHASLTSPSQRGATKEKP